MAKIVSAKKISAKKEAEYHCDGKQNRPEVNLDDGTFLILKGRYANYNNKFVVAMNSKYSKYIDRAVNVATGKEEISTEDGKEYVKMVRDLYPQYVLTCNADEDDLGELFQDENIFPDEAIADIGVFFILGDNFKEEVFRAETVKKRQKRSPRRSSGKRNTKTRSKTSRLTS